MKAVIFITLTRGILFLHLPIIWREGIAVVMVADIALMRTKMLMT